MATHAHSTRTPLLPLSRSPQPLLGQGLGRQSGPVTQAIRAMRAPSCHLHGVRQLGDDHNVGKSDVFRFEDRGIRALARAEVEDLIGGLIDLLDAMDGDADLEVENEHGGDVQDEPHDPEEDMGAEEDEGSIGLLAFDGTNYSPWRRA